MKFAMSGQRYKFPKRRVIRTSAVCGVVYLSSVDTYTVEIHKLCFYINCHVVSVEKYFADGWWRGKSAEKVVYMGIKNKSDEILSLSSCYVMH